MQNVKVITRYFNGNRYDTIIVSTFSGLSFTYRFKNGVRLDD